MTVTSEDAPGTRPPERGRVEIDRVAIDFPGKGGVTRALTPTTLTLEPGTFTAIIGPSGCGKSTLMNAAAGFLAPTEGEIRIDGRPVTGPDPEVGVIFQQYALFPWFSALGNVKFALRRLGLPKAELEARARAALAEVGLAGQERKYPGQLSGGMKQRVARFSSPPAPGSWTCCAASRPGSRPERPAE